MSLGKRQLELLGLIAESNRANTSRIHSLDCYYSHDFSNPVHGCEPIDSADVALTKKVAKKGRYAFSGSREYSSEEITSEGGGGVLFVRNGSRVWMRFRCAKGGAWAGRNRDSLQSRDEARDATSLQAG